MNFKSQRANKSQLILVEFSLDEMKEHLRARQQSMLSHSTLINGEKSEFSGMRVILPQFLKLKSSPAFDIYS